MITAINEATAPAKEDDRDATPAREKPIPVAIQRLMDEVCNEQATPQGLHDRTHNRHNSS